MVVSPHIAARRAGPSDPGRAAASARSTAPTVQERNVSSLKREKKIQTVSINKRFNYKCSKAKLLF